jgi:hypothetical protein
VSRTPRYLRSASLLVAAAVALSVSAAGRPAPSRVQTAAVPVQLRAPASRQAPATGRVVPLIWCGNGETADNRLPQADPTKPETIRVLYAVPAGMQDRFGDLAGAIDSDIGAIDAWWQTQDPTRAPRWDLYPFAGCAGGIPGLDLGMIRLAHEAAYYAHSGGYQEVVDEVAPHLAATEKAIVFLDGWVEDSRVCGVSKVSPHNGGRYGITVIALRSDCGSDLGSGAFTARVTAHELIHNLGAVMTQGPPHECRDPGLSGHVCDSQADIMFPYAVAGMTLTNAVLDVGHDDYYAHSGSWWDVQDSAWLVHLPRRTLVVVVIGPGTVSSTPAAIRCPDTCSTVLDDGFQLRLDATPGAEAEFYGWKGGCSGLGSCALTVTGDVSVQATFGEKRVQLSVTVGGRGRVTSRPAGIRCPGRCTARFSPGTSVALLERAAKGWKLAGWSNGCGRKTTCSVRLTSDSRETATFVRDKKKG